MVAIALILGDRFWWPRRVSGDGSGDANGDAPAQDLQVAADDVQALAVGLGSRLGTAASGL